MSVLDLERLQTAPVTPHTETAAVKSAPKVSARVRTRVAADLVPPQLWSEAVPPLRATWSYLTEGEQCAEEGPARAGARIYAGICLPVRGVLLSLDWLVQRPARLLAALTLYVLLAHVGIGSFLPLPF